MRRMTQRAGRAALLLALALLAREGGGARAVGGGPPAAYFPDVNLRPQDGKEVRFYDDLIKGKIVVINFMYTRCDGKLCGQGTKNLVQVQKALGDRVGKQVFMYSITLDPEHDTPEVLKRYMEDHEV